MSANAAREVARNLRAIRGKVSSNATRSAATAAGRSGETAVKMVLQVRTHELGTRTPSPAGSVPAKISGDLARSVQRAPTAQIAPGVAVTSWGPVAEYGTVQEFGATITAKNFPQLGNPKVGFFGKSVVIPARPFMRPTTVKLIDSGVFAKVTAAAFLKSLGA